MRGNIYTCSLMSVMRQGIQNNKERVSKVSVGLLQIAVSLSLPYNNYVEKRHWEPNGFQL
jgi:hypothetical protein